VSYSADDLDYVIQKELSLQVIQGAQIAPQSLTPDKFCQDCMVIMKLKRYIYGFQLEYINNHQVKIKSGYSRSDEETGFSIETYSDLTVDIESLGKNGLDVDSEESNQWYYIWVIFNPEIPEVAGLISKSLDNPILPSGFTYKRRVGVVRNKNGNFLNFIQFGNGLDRKYLYYENLTSTLRILSNGQSSTWQDVSASVLCPPVTKTALINGTASRMLISPIRKEPAIPELLISYVFMRPKGTSMGNFHKISQNTIVVNEMPLDNNQEFQYKRTGNLRAYFSIQGFVEEL